MITTKTLPPAPQVKPLDWKAFNEGFGHGRIYYGTGVFGHWYAVSRLKAGLWHCVHHVGEPAHLPLTRSLDEAKAAAQADYESRIIAALAPAPQVAGWMQPQDCDGKEQLAFEAWASGERYDMHEHPLHYIFMDKCTNAARQGWKAALKYVREQHATNAPAPQTPVASIVPPHCTGTSFAFEPGVLHVKKDGSGHIVVNEDDFVLEDDRCEGPDGPEGSVHWIARLDASEITALRDFLNGTTAPASQVMGKDQ